MTPPMPASLRNLGRTYCSADKDYIRAAHTPCLFAPLGISFDLKTYALANLGA